MTPEQVEEAIVELQSSRPHSCAHKVVDCEYATLYLKEKNTFNVREFGMYKYVPVCRLCFRKGQHVSEKSFSLANKKEISIDEFKRGEDEHRKKEKEHSEKFMSLLNKRKEAWRELYQNHLKSDYWKTIRDKVLVRDKYLCQSCLEKRATQAHHLTYKHLGYEPAFDLAAICSDCHSLIHDNGKDYE